LASGKLSGKFRRGQPIPADSRTVQGGAHGPETNFDHLYNIVDALDEVAEETGKSVAQISINWLLQRPTVANIIIGARNEEQLKQNLGAIGWNLTTDQVKKLDAASDLTPIYPYWHQRQNPKLIPLPIQY
jgi:aryl-alcohol dehydrogenase-like predicted oxidoreductase